MRDLNNKYLNLLFLSTCFIFLHWNTNAQTIHVSTGKIVPYENFPSRYVRARNVSVWLPDGYSSKKKYDVLYMHDGQMLFDSTVTWNHQEWGVDETMGKLLAEKRIRSCIVVGIWNIPDTRFADYFPQKIIDSIEEPSRTTILTKQIIVPPDADNYLKFLVRELKPFIDSAYSTDKTLHHTFIMGSSMGGLISVYGLCEYPGVFGGAACLSIHSPLASFELINDRTDAEVASKFRNYLRAKLPIANTRKIYFDYGDQTGDAYYKSFQDAIDKIMRELGYSSKFWNTKFFPGESHSEKSWSKRLDIPLLFLLKK